MIARLICIEQSQSLKSAKRERDRERERIEMKKAPLLRRAASKHTHAFLNLCPSMRHRTKYTLMYAKEASLKQFYAASRELI